MVSCKPGCVAYWNVGLRFWWILCCYCNITVTTIQNTVHILQERHSRIHYALVIAQKNMTDFFFYLFPVPCIFYRLQNKSFQQMQPTIHLYCICYFSPYMFRALTGPSSGVSRAACLCYHLAPISIINNTISGNTWQVKSFFVIHWEPNGSISKQPGTPLMMGQ
jgi:hypothetical protein